MPVTKSIFSFNNAALALAALFSTHLNAQESPITHESSHSCRTASGILICTACRECDGLLPLLTQGNIEWRVQSESQKPSQLISSRIRDDDVDDERNEKGRDRNKKGKEKKGEKSKKTHDRPNSQKKADPEDHHVQHSFAPVHPEALELLRNMNRTLKSIEAMMREDAEQDRKRPEQALQQWNKMPPMLSRRMPGMQMPGMHGPQMPGPQMPGPQMPGPQMPGPQMHGPNMQMQMQSPSSNQSSRQRQEEGNRGPSNFGPRNDGPRNDGPR